MSIVAGVLALLSAGVPLPGAMQTAITTPGPVAVAASGTTKGGQVPLGPCTSANRSAYWAYAIAAAVQDAVPTLANGCEVSGFTGVSQGQPVYVASDGSLSHTAPSSGEIPVQQNLGTVSATTSFNIIVPDGCTSLAQLAFAVKTTVATDDTNYWTVSVANQGNSAAAMLAATAPNTNKVTGGTAFTAETERLLTLTATTANLAVTAGQILEVTFTKTASAANLVECTIQAIFNAQRSSGVDSIGVGISTTTIYFFRQ